MQFCQSHWVEISRTESGKIRLVIKRCTVTRVESHLNAAPSVDHHLFRVKTLAELGSGCDQHIGCDCVIINCADPHQPDLLTICIKSKPVNDHTAVFQKLDYPALAIM